MLGRKGGGGKGGEDQQVSFWVASPSLPLRVFGPAGKVCWGGKGGGGKGGEGGRYTYITFGKRLMELVVE